MSCFVTQETQNLVMLSSIVTMLLFFISTIARFMVYHMQGKITECWLAETEGIFS